MPTGDIYIRKVKNRKEELFYKIFGKKSNKK